MNSPVAAATKPDIVGRTYDFALRLVRWSDGAGRGRPARGPLMRQLLRSGTSIGANVQEAQAGQSRPDFISKMSIALKEARESVYWLRLLRDAQLVGGEATDLLNEAQAIANILGAIVWKCKNPPVPPP